MLSKFHAYSTL